MYARELLKMGVEWCGVLLLVVMILPLLAVVAFVLRAAVIGVMVLGLAGVIVTYCVSRPIRRWANDVGRLGGDRRSVKESR